MATAPAPVTKALEAPAKPNEKNAFMETFEIISEDIVQDLGNYKVPKEGVEHIKRMLHYTVPGGKLNRGLTVPSALKSLFKRDLTKDELFKAQVLGWGVEWLQAFFLITDDIMDGSITRRGQPCWYKQPDIGMIAINDAIICESAIYRLLKKYFRAEAYYPELVEMFHEVTYQTELGQMMDLLTAPEDHVDLSKFSPQKHAYIVEYKTAYYSFYLPIALAMRLAAITDEKAYAQAKAVLLPLGEYFQVQDDYLDCYGSPEVIGKVGTDIEDNKCGWLIIQALERATVEQRQLLDANYGQKSPENVAIVKRIYEQLHLETVYREYEDRSYKRISELIEQIDESLLPRDIFVTFMNR
ncbi:isoprenoid synthase domain-containing protein [Fimicolochytrium jonesii]|uniref:isoprenoid synthase domain-containing protein n=1 Tax=Fimicolochytrium jonesii TaxID=1396493 RepID=UPI0022FDC5C7|nr:isoprenoid synthase domain-containing protein [Fimicolochytrium jonesii]KAI8824143.1 isoprenoid synthase domain-containing protein [Fimicolochytrium jonesii]